MRKRLFASILFLFFFPPRSIAAGIEKVAHRGAEKVEALQILAGNGRIVDARLMIVPDACLGTVCHAR